MAPVTRKARVFVHGKAAGVLKEIERGTHYIFSYLSGYQGPPVSLTMPLEERVYDFDAFPPYFEGLLPEGVLLQALLKQSKIDERDYFSQLMAVGGDLVGAITVEQVSGEMASEESTDHVTR